MYNSQNPLARNILVDLDVETVSLCNQGVNTRAHILLAKGKENKEMPKTFEELMKALTPEQAELVTKHIGAIEEAKDGDIAELTKSVTALEEKVTALEAGANQPPAGDEGVAKSVDEILKAASPELAEYVATLQKSVGSLIADREETIAKARFEEVKAIPCEEEVLKSVLKSASPAVFEVLKKAATAIEEKVLTAKGKETSSDEFTASADMAYAKLDKSAKAIALEKGITYEQAFTQACNADPATYTSYTKGVN